jgi:hypothetical protein
VECSPTRDATSLPETGQSMFPYKKMLTLRESLRSVRLRGIDRDRVGRKLKHKKKYQYRVHSRVVGSWCPCPGNTAARTKPTLLHRQGRWSSGTCMIRGPTHRGCLILCPVLFYPKQGLKKPIQNRPVFR